MEKNELKDKLVSINRITKVVKGGRRFAFSALVVVGNYAGSIGVGYAKAKQVPDAIKKANQTDTVAKFLLNNNDLRHVVRRAFIVEKFPYSEIQDNTIGASLIPIDMLRLKLSFFGAVKFDPRSDKWLRINMYQGAPLPHEMKLSNDNWVYDSLN